MMIAVTGILVVAVLVRFLRRTYPARGRVHSLYLGLLIVASALASIGGHWGGKLVYGDAYLPF